MTAGTPRRHVLVLGAAGVVTVATGCTVYGDDDPPAPGPPSDGGDGGDGGTVVATTGEIEVGGGVIRSENGVVITQPVAGDFRGFSSVCTHQGCTVTSIGDGTIDCSCHGSRFSIEDGSVVQPAAGLSADDQDPLPEVAISVEGDQISIAP